MTGTSGRNSCRGTTAIRPIDTSFTRCGPSAAALRVEKWRRLANATSLPLTSDRIGHGGACCRLPFIVCCRHIIIIDHVFRGPDMTALGLQQPATGGGSMKTYVVEHLDPECGPWSTLEYITIAKESTDAGAAFCLSSAPLDLDIPDSVKAVRGFNIDHRSVEDVYHDRKDRVCLLDPAAKEELKPADAEDFDVFVFGGILGTKPITRL